MLANRTPGLAPDDPVFTEIGLQYDIRIYSARRHRKVWQLNTSAGPKYLKQTGLHPADLRFIREALEHLKRHRFTRIPLFLPAKSGEPFAVVQDRLYTLTDWYLGMELDYRILMDVRQAAAFLAVFHLKSRGFEPVQAGYRTVWHDWPEKLAGRIRDLTEFRKIAWAEKETSAFSRLFLRYFEPFYRQANLSYQRFLTSPYPDVARDAAVTGGFCHHDFSGRNLIRTYDNRLILVDFDYCLRDIRIHDLINLLIRNLKHNYWEPGLSRFILSEYHRAYPLTPKELEVLYVLLCWPQEFWQVGLQYYREKLPWPEGRFLKKLEHKIDQRFQKEKFLAEFPGHNGIYHWRENSVSQKKIKDLSQ
jgi:CotS family spore coat protein